MKEFLTSISAGVIVLIVEYYIVKPVREEPKSITNVGMWFILAAVIGFPIGALVLLTVYWSLMSSGQDIVRQSSVISRIQSPPVWDGQYLDVIVLVILIYTALILFLILYRSNTFEFRSEIAEQENSQQPMKLNEAEDFHAARYAIMKSIFLFQPLFLIWKQIFIGQIERFSYYLLLSVSVLIFNSIYLYRYKEIVLLRYWGKFTYRQRGYGHKLSLFNRKEIKWTSTIVGMALFPAFILIYRVAGEIGLSWKLIFYSSLTTFIFIPVLWLILVQLYSLVVGVIIQYLFEPLQPAIFLKN